MDPAAAAMPSGMDAPAFVVSRGNGGVILAGNEAFCRYSGYAEEDLVGMPLQSLQPLAVAGSEDSSTLGAKK